MIKVWANSKLIMFQYINEQIIHFKCIHCYTSIISQLKIKLWQGEIFHYPIEENLMIIYNDVEHLGK